MGGVIEWTEDSRDRLEGGGAGTADWYPTAVVRVASPDGPAIVYRPGNGDRVWGTGASLCKVQRRGVDAMTSKVLLLAPFLRHWEDLGLESPLGGAVGLRAPAGSPGCCLVFDSFEALLEVYPDADLEQVMTFREP